MAIQTIKQTHRHSPSVIRGCRVVHDRRAIQFNSQKQVPFFEFIRSNRNSEVLNVKNGTTDLAIAKAKPMEIYMMSQHLDTMVVDSLAAKSYLTCDSSAFQYAGSVDDGLKMI